jgi:hypothetical protein
MNSKLRKAVYKKRQLHNVFKTQRSSKSWEQYQKQRNIITKIKIKSIRNYFLERCVGGPKNKDFWSTIKPFLTNKVCNFETDIILNEDDKLLNDQSEISNVFNNFFVNVAKDIGKDSTPINDCHPSICKIKDRCITNDCNSELFFKPVSDEFVEKQINKINIKKATGIDQISPKILKIAKHAVVAPITQLINLSINTCTFPDKLKIAQVVPIHKKNSTLLKGNYRPVSILPTISKNFERAIDEQLVTFFYLHFNIYLSAFRSGYSCQDTLIRIIEDWKNLLDNNQYVAAILMDLSKAFDCLPHNLLLLKLENYGVSENSLKLLQSYLTGRKQCVKIGSVCSSFLDIYKGVPQGSILGPVMFNIFINDIFDFVKKGDLHNYADDNTLSYGSNSVDDVIETLEEQSAILIKWFTENHMQANPDKFQAISIGRKTHEKNLSFMLQGNKIDCEDEVKLLGVTFDFKLTFNSHVSHICKKASQQLNVLKRIGNNLSKLGKLTIYYSFILSNFNYCPLVWHFCGESNTKKLEKIQERALRFIYNDSDSSYENLLEKSQLPSLRLRRLRSMAIEVFKIINKQTPVYLHDLVTIKKSSYSFRYNNTVNIPRVNTTRYGLHSLRYGAAKLWNELPNDLREGISLNNFKNLISKWDGDGCSCSFCS